jgi:predicted MPP superfamily phosphohydrolase
MTIGRGMISRRAALKALLATGVGAATGEGAYGYLYERHALELTQSVVPVSGLAPSLAGLKIGLITDIHRSRWVSSEEVEAAGRMLMAAKPDLIILGGDYVTWGNRYFVGSAAESVRGLSAPHGVFGILGNHDDDHDMPAALDRSGRHPLLDQTRI